MGTLKQTHTYVELEISKAAYDEIADKLRAAGYDHVFMVGGAIDMHGLALINFVKADGSTPDARGHSCLQPEEHHPYRHVDDAAERK